MVRARGCAVARAACDALGSTGLRFVSPEFAKESEWNSVLPVSAGSRRSSSKNYKIGKNACGLLSPADDERKRSPG